MKLQCKNNFDEYVYDNDEELDDDDTSKRLFEIGINGEKVKQYRKDMRSNVCISSVSHVSYKLFQINIFDSRFYQIADFIHLCVRNC